MAKKQLRFVYPEYQDLRVGCKVKWYYYKNRKDAETASKVAYEEGIYYAGKGYDYGYCQPGSIMEVKKGKYAGLFEVCLP